MQLKVKKLQPQAVPPRYSTAGSNGLDFIAINVQFIQDSMGLNNCIIVNTGVSIEIPEGHVGLLFPRSSVSNRPWALANSVGVIDSDYRGEVVFKFRFTGSSNIQWEKTAYKVGDKVGQLVVMPSPRLEVVGFDDLSATKRGDGGFGSTGE